MAKERNANQRLNSDEVERKDAGTQPPRGDVLEGRGGTQADQISGETSKASQKQGAKNSNSRAQSRIEVRTTEAGQNAPRALMFDRR